MNRRLKIIFTLSVMLNMSLAGVIVGACYKRMDGPPGFTDSRDPQADNNVARAMAAARKGQEVAHKDMKEAKKELVSILAAPDFSEEKFNAASEKVNQAQGALFKARHEATLKMAKEMTLAERKEMARFMQSMSERRGERFKGHGGPERK